MASMSNVLQKKKKNKLLFMNYLGSTIEVQAYLLWKKLMNTKMVVDTPIRDHVLKIISYINELEILGAEVDGEIKIDAIPSSFCKSFNPFILNFRMNKLDVTSPDC